MRVLVVVLAVVACAGCSLTGLASSGAERPVVLELPDDPTAVPGDAEPVPWDDPFGPAAVPVSSIEDARAALAAAGAAAFTPVAPLREATLAVAAPPGGAATLLALVEVEGGRVLVSETVYSDGGTYGSDPAATTWPAHLLSACTWCTERRIVVLAGGQHAAVLRDRMYDRLQVTWLQDATTWIVLTAEEAVADDEALALADELAAQARRP